MSRPRIASRLGLAAFAALCLLLPGQAPAQSFTAGVRGTITDETAAAVSGAKVVVTDAERGTTFIAASDETGRYAIPALPPGNYVLTVEAPGFKRFSSGRFALTVQQQATV